MPTERGKRRLKQTRQAYRKNPRAQRQLARLQKRDRQRRMRK